MEMGAGPTTCFNYVWFSDGDDVSDNKTEASRGVAERLLPRCFEAADTWFAMNIC